MKSLAQFACCCVLTASLLLGKLSQFNYAEVWCNKKKRHVIVENPSQKQVSRLQEKIQRAVKLHEAGKFHEAARLYNQILSQINDKSGCLHNNLASALLSLRKYPEAISQYRKAIAINPNYDNAYYNLGNTYDLMGNIGAAKSCFEKTIALNPASAKAYNNLGAIHKDLGNLEEARRMYIKAIQINPDFCEAHNNLGAVFKERKEYEAAIKCFEKAIAIDLNHLDAHSNIAATFKRIGNREKAAEHYSRVVKLNPQDQSALHMLNSLTGTSTEIAPREYVVNLFNQFASNFDRDLSERLEYSSPKNLRTALDNVFGTRKIYETALDLGCGTGFSGLEFRNKTKTLGGVDLSPEMLKQAKSRGIYDHLFVKDLLDFLRNDKNKYDLFIATDVLIYLGNLDPVFSLTAARSNKDACFVFSTEIVNNQSYVLQETGRYAHSKTYVLELAAKYGFKIESVLCQKIRKEKGAWVFGYHYVIRYENEVSLPVSIGETSCESRAYHSVL